MLELQLRITHNIKYPCHIILYREYSHFDLIRQEHNSFASALTSAIRRKVSARVACIFYMLCCYNCYNCRESLHRIRSSGYASNVVGRPNLGYSAALGWHVSTVHPNTAARNVVSIPGC